MKKLFLIVILMTCLSGRLSAELDFCDKSLIAILCPSISEFDSSLDMSFFGTFEKESVENLTLVYNIGIFSLFYKIFIDKKNCSFFMSHKEIQNRANYVY